MTKKVNPNIDAQESEIIKTFNRAITMNVEKNNLSTEPRRKTALDEKEKKIEDQQLD